MIRVGGVQTRVAREILRSAEQRVLDALKADYPINAEVEVVHARGTFRGKVVGWNLHGTRVSVYNHVTGKTRDWWFENVQNLAAKGGAA
jgi:hypothetical protein